MPETANIPTERHPFEPFLPKGAKVLFLGSFPPQEKRWSIDFYYPNFINDFWRITGLIFFGDKEWFIARGAKRFDKEKIIQFCTEKGIAMYDTATQIRRLKDNASDKFLEVVTPTDIPSLLERIPDCSAIVTTGQKATETLCETFGCEVPLMGGCRSVTIGKRSLNFFRLPSTSRAYPLAIEKKAETYRNMYFNIGLI